MHITKTYTGFLSQTTKREVIAGDKGLDKVQFVAPKPKSGQEQTYLIRRHEKHVGFMGFLKSILGIQPVCYQLEFDEEQMKEILQAASKQQSIAKNGILIVVDGKLPQARGIEAVGDQLPDIFRR